MLHATVVTTKDELVQINQLNKQNLKGVVSSEERKEQGFVTWLYALELLEQMHSLAPSIIVKDGEQVVGYALATPKEATIFHNDLKEMIKNLEKVHYNKQPVTTYNFYLMGQICIHKDYRGKGIFNMLYYHHKTVYGSSYELLVTEISTSNHRSQKAHEKLGFKTIYTYHDALDEWKVVVWDWCE